MAAVNRRFLLDGCFLYLWVLFNVNDDGKDKELINFGFERSSRRGIFRYFAVGNAVHPGIVAVATIAVITGSLRDQWFPYDRCDRYDR